MGLKIENIIEYIESKTLDAFFGYKHEDYESSSSLLNNLINWIFRLKTEIRDNSILSPGLTDILLSYVEKIDDGVRNLKISIEEQNYDQGDKEIEKILKAIRNFYDLRKFE